MLCFGCTSYIFTANLSVQLVPGFSTISSQPHGQKERTFYLRTVLSSEQVCESVSFRRSSVSTEPRVDDHQVRAGGSVDEAETRTQHAIGLRVRSRMIAVPC